MKKRTKRGKKEKAQTGLHTNYHPVNWAWGLFILLLLIILLISIIF